MMCRITCRGLHHSVTHSLPRAEYPGGCWRPLAIMNYKAGHSRPGRSSLSHTGPQACLSPTSQGLSTSHSHPHTSSFFYSNPTIFPKHTAVLFPSPKPYPEAEEGSHVLRGSLISFNIWPVGNKFKNQCQVMLPTTAMI